MRKYTAFFRIRFSAMLQYRTAALAAMATQFVWGGMELLVYRAFYQTDPAAFPMTFQETASYVWLTQAFLSMFMLWRMEVELFESVRTGDVGYELLRPVDLYNMWFVRSVASRTGNALLRSIPILFVAALLPSPYGIGAPAGPAAFGWFLFTMLLGLGNVCAFCMLICLSAFFTVSADGLRTIAVNGTELLCGSVIPFPFFPDGIRQVVELLPFAAMQNVPFRVYSGALYGAEMYRAILLQVFWLAVMTGFGKWLASRGIRRTVIQGG